MRRFWIWMNIIYEKCMFALFIVALLVVLYGLYDAWYVYNKASDDSYLKYKPTTEGVPSDSPMPRSPSGRRRNRYLPGTGARFPPIPQPNSFPGYRTVRSPGRRIAATSPPARSRPGTGTRNPDLPVSHRPGRKSCRPYPS